MKVPVLHTLRYIKSWHFSKMSTQGNVHFILLQLANCLMLSSFSALHISQGHLHIPKWLQYQRPSSPRAKDCHNVAVEIHNAFREECSFHKESLIEGYFNG